MPQVNHIRTDDPLGVALQNMGRAARQAGHTFTVQEWANRLATLAGPRDYVGQLRELYNGILKRWRYVMEPGERVPGSASAVLKYTLGAKYNCADPLRCDVERTDWKHKGWGDCDDVSTLTAAGVIALGMVPIWRVVQWPNGAHVSVLARTPRGRVVSVDPVGHPNEQFGWAMDPPGSRVLTFDLDGRPLGGATAGAQPMGTYLAGIDGISNKRSSAAHLVQLHPLSPQGPRFLAVPRGVQQAMLRGYVVDKAPAVDQYGQRYEYIAGVDMWAPMDGRRSRRKKARRARRAKRRGARLQRRTVRRKKVARFVRRVRKGVAKMARGIGRSKVAKFFRKMKSKILGSKLVQGLASKALQLFGVPPEATKAILQREADLAKRGGRSRIVELLADGKAKEAAQLIGGSFKGAARGLTKGLNAKISAMGAAYEQQYAGCVTCHQGGAAIPVAYVSGFYSANHMLGAADSMNVTSTPTPGAWYQVKKGDNVGEIARQAYGSRNLTNMRRINDAPYNGRFVKPADTDYERKYFKDGIIGLYPRYPEPNTQRLDEGDGGEFDGGMYPALWIPSDSKPDAPPMAIDEPEEIEPEPADEQEDEPEIDTTPETPDEMPQVTCPPQDYRHGLKWTPSFLNPLNGKMTEAAWTCVPAAIADPRYICEPGEGYGQKPDGTWGCYVPSAAPAKPIPAPKPKPAPTPQPQPTPQPAPVQDCPQWFRHPTAAELAQGMQPSSCLPVKCPPGYSWKSAAQGGGILGGCVRDPIPSQPEPTPEAPPVVVIPMLPGEPTPTPRPRPAPQPRPAPGAMDLRAPIIAALMAMVSS